MAESILQLLNELKQDISKTATPLVLLQEAGRILAKHPLIERVVFYRASRGGMVIWHDTRDPNSQSFLTLSKYPQYERILAKGGLDYAHPLMAIGLQTSQAPFGLMEIEVNQRIEKEQYSDFELIVQYIANRLDNALLRQLLYKQAETTMELNQCQNFADIARVLGKHIAQKGQFISINIFDFNDAGKPIACRTVASASSTFSQANEISMDVLQYTIDAFVQALDETDEILYADILTDARLDDTVRVWLKSLKIRSLYAVTLRLHGKVQGFVALNDTQRPLAIDDTEMMVFHGLIEQSASLIENRELISQATVNFDELRTVYDVTSSLLHAETIPEMLQVLYKTVGRGIRSISLLDISYNPQGLVDQIILRYLLDQQGNVTNPNANMIGMMEESARESLTNYMNSQGDELDFVEDMTTSNAPMSKQFVAQGIKSSITIPIVENNLRTAQISMTWSESRAFDERIRRIVITIQQQFALVLQNRRLFEESRQRAEQSVEQVRVLSVSNELSGFANTVQDEKTLLDNAAKILQEATRVDHVGIALINERYKSGVVVSEFPFTNSVGQVLSPEDVLTATIRQTHEPAIVENVATDQRLGEQSRTILLSIGIQALFVVPIFEVDDTLIGSIGFDLYRPNVKPDTQAIDLAKTIALQLSLNLQKFRLYANTQRQAIQIQKINAFGQSVQANQDTATILGYAFDYLRQIVDYDYVAVYAYDVTEKTLGMIGRNMYSDITLFDKPQAIKLENNSVLQYVWDEYETVQIDDLNLSTEWTYPMRQVVRSLVALPLMSGGRAFGVLELASYEPFAYIDLEMSVLRQMANQLAVALDNAEAYARSQQQALIKTRANDVSTRLQQQADVDGMIRVAVEEVGRMFNARRARIRLGSTTMEQEK